MPSLRYPSSPLNFRRNLLLHHRTAFQRHVASLISQHSLPANCLLNTRKLTGDHTTWACYPQRRAFGPRVALLNSSNGRSTIAAKIPSQRRFAGSQQHDKHSEPHQQEHQNQQNGQDNQSPRSEPSSGSGSTFVQNFLVFLFLVLLYFKVREDPHLAAMSEKEREEERVRRIRLARARQIEFWGKNSYYPVVVREVKEGEGGEREEVQPAYSLAGSSRLTDNAGEYSSSGPIWALVEEAKRKGRREERKEGREEKKEKKVEKKERKAEKMEKKENKKQEKKETKEKKREKKENKKQEKEGRKEKKREKKEDKDPSEAGRVRYWWKKQRKEKKGKN